MTRINALGSTVLLLIGLASGVALHVVIPPRCLAPDETNKGRLVSFVRSKYNLPPDAQIGVADGGPVSSSCFRKLIFSSLSGRRFEQQFFVSPDYRFLTTALIDAKPDPKAEEERQRQTAEALDLGDPPVLGREQAPVTLAIFSDFQCPFCAAMARSLDRLTASEGDSVRVVYHYFPLPSHRWAKKAAEAAACAQRQSNYLFWSLYRFLFDNQSEISADKIDVRLTAWARTAPSLDQIQFQKCVSGSLTSGQIEQDIALGSELGVHATPSLFVNGVPINISSGDDLRDLVHSAAAVKGRNVIGAHHRESAKRP